LPVHKTADMRDCKRKNKMNRFFILVGFTGRFYLQLYKV
jgi:hypothetical protein